MKWNAFVVLKYNIYLLLKIALCTQKTEKLCSWTYSFKNSQEQQLVKNIILSI